MTHEADAEEPAEEEEKPTPESKGSTDDVQFKGKSAAGDEDNKVDDTRKVEDDSKGAKKLRIDSDAAKDLGAGETHREDGSETVCAVFLSIPFLSIVLLVLILSLAGRHKQGHLQGRGG